ncbi:MAG: ABC transporter ATP-binding protein, partial [Flavihumibacter sp.]
EPMNYHKTETGYQARNQRVDELLSAVNLSPAFRNRYPHAFSGGQRQRIGIARALALRPGFILFDESVSALDVSVQAQVLNLINRLKNELGFTAIFISHDLGVVRYIADRILVMEKGQIVESGDAETVFSQPANPYTRKLLDSIPGNSLPSRALHIMP